MAIELALENRHRSVTLASFTCSGSEVTEGLFLDMDPREGAGEIPRRQGSCPARPAERAHLPRGRSQHATYAPVYLHGGTQVSMQSVVKTWCPPPLRKRAIDLVLLSIGGNDVGFGALAAYSLTESITDLAPIAGLAGLTGHSSRFSPQVSRIYLEVLDERMQTLKQGCGFGVPPARRRAIVLRADPSRRDRCAVRDAALGMDVYPGLRLSRQRLQETADFLQDLLGRLECIAGEPHRLPRRSRDRRRHRLSAGDRAHSRVRQARAVRARPQANARRRHRHAHTAQGRERFSLQALFAGGHATLCPPVAPVPNPQRRLPRRQYAPRLSLFDILQPAYAALYSGAIHPTAEAHAIVADHVLGQVRAVVDRPDAKPDLLEQGEVGRAGRRARAAIRARAWRPARRG